MSALQKALDGSIKKHPILFTLIMVAAVFGVAWRLLLRPRSPHISLREVDVYEWNLTRGTFNNNSNTVVTSASKLVFHVKNPSFCWRVHLKQAQIQLYLLTPHFKVPLAAGKFEALRIEARKNEVARARITGDGIPLFFNSRYLNSQFRLLLKTKFHSTPRSNWFWVPFRYKNHFDCQLLCSTKAVKEGKTKLIIQKNQCGLALKILS